MNSVHDQKKYLQIQLRSLQTRVGLRAHIDSQPTPNPRTNKQENISCKH